MFMSLFDDPFFGPRSEKERKRQRIRRNRRQGKAAEDQVRMEYNMRGYEMERTGHGSDFRAKKRDFLTGEVVDEKLVEVKSGNAELSELQKKTKNGRKDYVVERRDPFFF